MKKVCIATGTRAEYGLLKPVIEKVFYSEKLELQLLVTGMHLSPEFGLTYREIEKDGFPISGKIEMLLSADTSSGISKSMGVALISVADFFEINKPDLVVILGDRYEMLAVATAAMISKIPIAHIHGGEATEGLIDEAIRHSITKMSQIHFTATEVYRRRVIQLGEQPEQVFNVGSLGVENAKTITLMSKVELEDSIKFKFTDKTILVTYHPVTLENMSSKEQFENLLKVIDRNKEIRVIFTKANSDTDGRIINQLIDEYVMKNSDRCCAFVSLGQLRYLSALQYCCAVAGNSSSGIIEVPSFKIPTIDIGDRQRGRSCAESVIHCGNNEEEISAAFEKAFSEDFLSKIKYIENPYDCPGTSEKIIHVISAKLEQGIDIKKVFYDIE